MKYQPPNQYPYRGIIEHRDKSLINNNYKSIVSDTTKSIVNHRMNVSTIVPRPQISIYRCPDFHLSEALEEAGTWTQISHTWTSTGVNLTFNVGGNIDNPIILYCSGMFEPIGGISSWSPS